uniref:Uncharacterized protein n=1 Tax=Physcomitrium patens TaxID=3218 RepID=A0A7I4EMM8_PHYPA
MHTAITQGWNLHELTYQEGSEWESVARCSHVSTAISSSIVGEDSPRIQLNPDADSATNQPKVALLGPKQRRWMGRNGPSHLGHEYVYACKCTYGFRRNIFLNSKLWRMNICRVAYTNEKFE